MKSRKIEIVLLAMLACFAQIAHADALNDLVALTAKARTVIGNSAQIDPSNPEQAQFKTNLDGQLVELNLVSARLNDAFLSTINYNSQVLMAQGGVRRLGSRTTGSLNFADLKITLDGCDITSALINQCTTNNCWDPSATPSPATSFHDLFATKIYLNLSALNPRNIAGCSAWPTQSSFFAANTQHTISFQEQTPGRAGTLNYQIIIYQTTAQ